MTAAVDSHLRLSWMPTGWFAVAFGHELTGGAVLRRRVNDRERVVFRTGAGVAVVMDAYCPHLGAHLAEGGRVVGDQLRCPFHDLGFAADGRCVHSPYRTGAPPKLRARTWPVRELHGVIVMFDGGQADREPGWDLAAIAADRAALPWSAPVGRLWRLRTHPQEIIENTVDIGHFAAVHGYRSVDVSAAMATDGPHLTMGYTVTRGRGLLGRLQRRPMRMQLAITASGVGYSRVEVDLVGLPLRLRTVVMPTQVDAETTEVRVITQVAIAGGGSPGRWLAGGIARIAAAEMARDFAADIRIWEHKRYRQPPHLVAGDGPIGPYRRWARQFHRDAAMPAALTVVDDSGEERQSV